MGNAKVSTLKVTFSRSCHLSYHLPSRDMAEQGHFKSYCPADVGRSKNIPPKLSPLNLAFNSFVKCRKN